MYILKLGFLDGYFGFLLACLYSHHTFCKYAKLKELSMKSSGSAVFESTDPPGPSGA